MVVFFTLLFTTYFFVLVLYVIVIRYSMPSVRRKENYQAAAVFWDGGNALNEETARRLNYALEMFRDQRVNELICVGGARPKDNVYGSTVMKDYLLDKGVPKNCIKIETKSFDTHSNLKQLVLLMIGSKISSLCIITDVLQAYRVRNILSANKETPFMEIEHYPFGGFGSFSAFIETWIRLHKEIAAFLMGKLLKADTYNRLLMVARSQLEP